MAEFYSDMAKTTGFSISSCQAGEIRAARGKITLPTTLALNDVVHMVKLPGDHVPVDVIVTSADLDGGTALVLHCGITADSVGTTEDPDAFIAGSTVGQAGGLARMTAVAGANIAAVNNERLVGFTVATAAGTPAAGIISLTLLYRAKLTGE